MALSLIQVPDALALYNAAEQSCCLDKHILREAAFAKTLSGVSHLCIGLIGLAADISQRFGGHRQIPASSVLYPILSAYLSHESHSRLERLGEEAKKLPVIRHDSYTHWRVIGITALNYSLFQALWFL